MAFTRYTRQEASCAGPRFRRALLIFYAAGAVVGLIAGIVWLMWLTVSSM